MRATVEVAWTPSSSLTFMIKKLVAPLKFSLPGLVEPVAVTNS